MIEGHRIFVSHSSADKDLTREVCDGLAPDGNEKWYEVLVDMERLEAGEPWPKQLHEWMARCHAGVLLLTRNAVKSPWVLKEATILAWRSALEPDFKLFIHQADDLGTTTDKIAKKLKKHGYGPLQLDQVQYLAAKEAAGIAAEVRAKVCDLDSEKSPFEWMIHKLSILLAGVDSGTLGRVAAKLKEFDAPSWSPNVDSQKRRATEAIARHLLCGSLGEYEVSARSDPRRRTIGLKGLMSDLGWELSEETLRKILHILAPHWIEGEAAARLGLLPAADPRRAAALNGERIAYYTLPLYVTRAHLDDTLMYEVLELPGGNAGDMAEHYTQAICEEFRRRRRALKHKKDSEVIDWLKRQPSDRYAVLPRPPPPEAAVTTLVDTFPTLSFVLSTGPDLRLGSCPDCVELLEPAVDVTAEERNGDDYDDCIELIERAQRG